MRQVFDLLIEAVAFVLIITTAFLSIFSRTTKNLFGYYLLTVNSSSMEPALKTGSLIVVKSISPSLLTPKEIITFKNPTQKNQLVTHRILEIKKSVSGYLFITKGDANNSSDRWLVSQDFLVGKMIFSFPYLGFLTNFVKKPLGFVIFILLPSFFIILWEIKKIVSVLEKNFQGKKGVNFFHKTIIFLFSLSILFSKVNDTGAKFNSLAENKNNFFSSRCWEKPSPPLLTFPSNNTFTNDTNVNFTWNSTISSCTSAMISYNFQLDDADDFSSPLVNTPFSNKLSYLYPNLPEGEYWWRVLVKDQFDNTSISAIHHLIVDRVAPTASLFISGSWTKVVSEKIVNGDFETGDLTGWTATGSVQVISSDTISNPETTITPSQGNWMIRIGNPDNPGNWLWENRLIASFESGAKNLSLSYNFFSRDFNPFDQPGFLIRLNGQEIFRLNNLESDGTTALTTGWQEFYYDLTNHNDSKINLSLYAGNTADKNNQSWVYVDKITTYFVAAPIHATYNIFSTDPFSNNTTASGTDYCQYKIDDNDWQTGDNFSILTSGPHTLQYHCVDRAGNSSPISQVNVITDGTAPSDISDLSVLSTTENSANLTWTAPGNDGTTGRASQYDIRYSSTLTDCSSFNFNSATKVEKVPSPQEAGKTETLEILGLNPETKYCFGIKTADEAPNWSNLSNIAEGRTASGMLVNAGDVVINELMWMGSSVSSADEWLELRNMTDREIDLSNFKLTKLVAGVETEMVISFVGKSIAPYGYFLIANGNSYANGDSQLKDTIVPDIWDASLDLSDTELQIKLYWNDGTTDHLIDTAWDGSAPTEGLFETTAGQEKYYSMERTSIPADGTNPLNWYTCIDEGSTAEFFDGGADERGTPKAPNRSENEPVAHQFSLTHSPSPTEAGPSTTLTPPPKPLPQPELILNISKDYKTLSFTVKNLINYIKLSYELTYDTDNGLQGLIGQVELNNQEEYTKENILLGTCSAGGTCIYHQNVKNIQLKVNLEDKNNKTFSFTSII